MQHTHSDTHDFAPVSPKSRNEELINTNVMQISRHFFIDGRVRERVLSRSTHPAVNKEVSAYLHHIGVDKFFIPRFR